MEASAAEMAQKWVGRSVKRVEDPRLLTGRGTYVDDMTIGKLHHAAIVRSPHAHARILRIDAGRAEALPGVIGVVHGKHVAEHSIAFPLGVAAPVKYYSCAVDRVRFVGEPVAVVVATDRYIAEDACALIDIDYEPLSCVLDPEKAVEDADSVILHENVGSNVANHRVLHYGDTDKAWDEADRIVKTGRLVFPKYSSTPMEAYVVAAQWNPLLEAFTIWSNFHGPFIMHPVMCKALGVTEDRMRFIVPADIGGGFGIKSSIFPYMTLMAISSKVTGVTVKWVEDRLEHLVASSSGTDRVSYLEAAVKNDGTILGVRMKIYDNVGGYIRTPEPACLYRNTGNYTGAYTFQNLRMDQYAVMTNKSLTGPNRGYGSQHLYFGLERLIDQIGYDLGIDATEVRLKNLIPSGAFPYTTPCGGIYDSGDYPKAVRLAMEMAKYDELRERRKKARADGKLYGIGVATAVDPSVTNMAYITVAWTPQERAQKGYLPKAGSSETGSVRIDPLGKTYCMVNTTPEGQGHETAVSQIVADELGVKIDDVHVITEFDTFTRAWSITSGSYSSRFASVGTSAVATAARRLKEKVLKIAAPMLEAKVEDLDARHGKVFVKGSPQRAVPIKHIAGQAHWSATLLPEGLEPGLQATCMFNFPNAKPPDDEDRVDSSQTYGFIAEIMGLEIDPTTGELTIDRYITVHDVGNLINPTIVDGQVRGGALHGVAGALYEEMVYDDNGQFLSASLMDYLCPTAMESPPVEIGHVVSPSPFTVLGSKGCGESSTMTAPAVVASAAADALRPLGIEVLELPLTPNKVWKMLQDRHEA